MNRLVVVFPHAHAAEDIVGCDNALDFGLSLVAVELKVAGVDIELNLFA